MAKTQPTGEQIRFRSANTGEHVLDTYLESAEIGGRNLTDLLDDLFDPSNNGTFRASNFEFRFDPATDKLQFRVGQFASATAGFTDLTTFFSIEGTFSTSTTYNNFDVVTLSNKDVYIVHGLSSGTTFSSESNFISSANTEKLVDVSGAQDWASKVNGIVDSTDYSSKAYAIGGTGVDTGSGSAKDWAIKTSGTVGNTSENSAKYHATAAASSASTATTQANLATTNGAAQVTLATAQVALATTQANNSASSASSSSTSATNSANSASAASTSETNAAASAATATTQAGLATSNGAAQVALATTQANNAASSATAASNSQTAAAASAASAANSYDQFDDRYHGSLSSNPSTDPDGNALASGMLYFNSVANEMRVFDGGNWIAASSAGTASLLIYKYTATSNQTSFSGSDDASNTLSYTVDNLIVTLNGVVLEVGTDVTATNGTTVVLASGAAANDELNVYAFKSFTTADMVSKTNGGAFVGNVDFGAGVDVTGNITVTGTVDGRDVAADGTKLDGIEASADVTDTANVVAALTAGTGISIAGNGTIANTASTDLVSDTSPQLGGDLQSNGHDIDFADNDKAVFGSDSDFTLHHNSTTGENLLSLTAGPLEMHQAGINSVLQVHNDGTNHNQLVQFFKGNSAHGNISTDTGKLIVNANGELNLRAGSNDIVTINNTGDITVKGQGSSRAMMVLQAGSNTSNSQLRFGDQAVDSAGRILYDHSNNFMRFDTNEAEQMRLTSAGLLLVNTTTEGIADYGDTLTIADTGHAGMTIRSGTSSEGNVYFSDGTSGDAEYKGIVKYDHSSNAMSFWSNSLRRMTITSDGKIGIATASPSDPLHVSGTSGAAAVFERTDSASVGIRLLGNGMTAATAPKISAESGPDMAFTVNNGEAARFNSSRTLLIGKTAENVATVGIEARGTGPLISTRDGADALRLNRLNSDGEIIQLRKDGTVVGTIGTQNWGIGTASPDALLQIEKSDSGTTIDKEPSSQSGPNIAIHNSNQTANNLSSIQFTNRGTNGVAETATAGIHVKHEAQGGTYSYGSMNFNTTNSAGAYATRMHIASGGNVGIGTASPTSASGGKVLAIETTADEHTNLVFNTANTGRNGIIEGRRTGRSGSERFAQINIQNNSDGGEIRFYTAGSGSDVSERARFDDSSNFLVGATSLNDTNGFTVFPTGSGSSTMVRIDRNSNGTALQFRQGQSAIGTVTTTTSGVTYNTTSDIRLKQDIEPLVATDKLMAMNPVSYNWKADPDGPRSMGFIAQEMADVMPEAVSTGDDDDAMMSMDYGRITPILVSALQDAHRKIEQLEQRLAAMEAK